MRTERDSMGEVEVPSDAYYGASTQRAVDNFPISNLRFSRRFIWALGLLKGSAARVSGPAGYVDSAKADAIAQAADEVRDGALRRQFVLDIFQTGSGTSTNTNANEVIAHRASELISGDFLSKDVHPNDHVNFGQSSNDVIPTAIHVAAVAAIREELLPALDKLSRCAFGQGRGVRRCREVGQDPPDGCDSRDAGPGVWRVLRSRSGRGESASRRCFPSSRSLLWAAPRWGAGSTHQKALPLR